MSKVKKPIIEEVEDNYEEEEFFNKDSYLSFIKKNNTPLLNADNYTSNDVHHVNIRIPDDNRITSEKMTMAEYTRVISERAQQIQNGSPIFIDIKDETEPIKIAELEIRNKRSPMKIIRHLTKNIVEHWTVNELAPPFK